MIPGLFIGESLSWLIPPKAQNEISYTLVDCVLQIQDNVMTSMKATL